MSRRRIRMGRRCKKYCLWWIICSVCILQIWIFFFQQNQFWWSNDEDTEFRNQQQMQHQFHGFNKYLIRQQKQKKKKSNRNKNKKPIREEFPASSSNSTTYSRGKEVDIAANVTTSSTSTIRDNNHASTSISTTTDHYDSVDKIAVAFNKRFDEISTSTTKNKTTIESYYPWCIPTKENFQLPPSYYKGGFLFHKLFKTGSSTAVGVHLRIAKYVGNLKFGNNNNNANTTSSSSSSSSSSSCVVQYKHQYALQNCQSHRKRHKSFLWTIIRNPISRSVSSMAYYNYDRPNNTISNQWMMEYLEATKNNQWIQLRDHPYSKNPIKARNGLLLNDGGLDLLKLLKKPNYQQTILGIINKQILLSYNFVAVLERWSESMVVLSLLLNIPLETTLVLKTKSSGGWTWDYKNQKRLEEQQLEAEQQNSSTGVGSCFQIPNYNIEDNDDIQNYLQTNFTHHHNYDFWLYHAVNISLDKTIDKLGRDRVATLVEKHKMLQNLVENKCSNQAIFPCSSTGKWQPHAVEDCYWRDMGCGYKCIDNAISEMTNKQQQQ